MKKRIKLIDIVYRMQVRLKMSNSRLRRLTDKELALEGLSLEGLSFERLEHYITGRWWVYIDSHGRSDQTWWLLIAKRQQILPQELVHIIQQYIACRSTAWASTELMFDFVGK